MSYAANPNKSRKDSAESAEAEAKRKQKADRVRIRRLIITLGDDTKKKVAAQIRGLAGVLEDETELHAELLLETAVECVRNLPLKTGVMAAWVTRMAENQEEWASSVVERCLEEFRSALQGGQTMVAQLLLRFMVCLGNTGTVALSSVMTLLEEVIGLSTGVKASKGGDLGMYLSLAALPFMSRAAFGFMSERVDGLVATAEAYMASRDARWKQVIRPIGGEELPDRLEALVVAVKGMRQADWASQVVLHVPGFEPSLEGRTTCTAKLVALGISAEDLAKSRFKLQVPLVAARLLVGQAVDDGETLVDHDRWLLEDHVLLTFETFGRDVEECSKQVLAIPVMHPQFEAIVVEVVFSQLLRLPSPPMLPLFYSRLLEGLAGKQASMKEVIEKAFGALFSRASELDEECIDVLAEAFAYYLIGNAYEADWSPFTVDGLPAQAKRLARRALERLQRLSFHQNLLHRLPEAVHIYMPPEPLAASDLPVQKKPEFVRMVGLARIKEPDERTVFKYCKRLMKIETKQELCKEKDEARSGVALPVEVGPVAGAGADVLDMEDDDDAERGAGREGEGKRPAAPQDESHRKKRRLDEAGDGTAVGNEGGSPTVCPSADGAMPSLAGDGAGDGAAPSDSTAVPPAGDKAPPAGDTASPPAASPGTGAGDEDGKKSKVPLRVKEELRHEDSIRPSDKKPNAVIKTETKVETEADPLGEPPAEPWLLEDVAELLVTAVMQNGSKTPTHLSKMLDGHEKVLLKLRPTDEDEAHKYAKSLVRCIFAFWRASGQRLEITLGSLLQRGVITPNAIVEYALEDCVQSGESITVWNMINSVARKSLERLLAIQEELALGKRHDKTEVVDRCKEQLETAVKETTELFTLIFTGLVRNHQDLEEKDQALRHLTSQRVLAIGRKYHAFIKPLIKAAESRIPGVAHNPEIAAVFQSLRGL